MMFSFLSYKHILLVAMVVFIPYTPKSAVVPYARVTYMCSISQKTCCPLFDIERSFGDILYFKYFFKSACIHFVNQMDDYIIN